MLDAQIQAQGHQLSTEKQRVRVLRMEVRKGDLRQGYGGRVGAAPPVDEEW
jgi:hypothetical protein